VTAPLALLFLCAIDEVRAFRRIAANADAGRLTQARCDGLRDGSTPSSLFSLDPAHPIRNFFAASRLHQCYCLIKVMPL
jgi:hypothetical protein